MPKIRVLVVDDSVVIRRLVTDILNSDPELEVVGAAANGKIALAKITQVNPDILTLDIEMPEMDGLQTLKELRKTYPKLPVIMFSTLTSRGGEATLEALTLGANDYVTKPANVGGITEGMQRVKDDLIPKIKALCGRSMGLSSGSMPQGKLFTRMASHAALPMVQGFAKPINTGFQNARPAVTKRIDIVAIGVSTGGPNALAEVLPLLPGNLPVPMVITQHMPPVFTRLLAERLSSKCALKVREGEPGAVLEPGTIWLAPGDYHMTLVRNGTRLHLALNQEPPENSCRPSVDVMFRSVVGYFSGNTLGVILTGMGQDGLRGCQYIKEAGGQVLAQDEASSVVWGMPGFVAKAGLADKVMPLDQIGPEIARRVNVGRALTVNTV